MTSLFLFFIGFVLSIKLSLHCCCALANKEDMVAVLKVFHVEYEFWHPEWMASWL